MILQMPHSFRWGDRAGVVISKIPAESVYGRRQRLACYVPKSGGERQIRHFSSALFWCTRFLLLFTWPCDWRYYAHYLNFIEFTSKFAGKVYPYARIKQRKYIKSPENLTKSVRPSGLFFLPGKCIQEGYMKQQYKLRKRVYVYDKIKSRRLCKIYTRAAGVNPFWFTFWGKNWKVNHIWFTLAPRPNAAHVEENPRIAHGSRGHLQNRRLARLWGCGAA